MKSFAIVVFGALVEYLMTLQPLEENILAAGTQ
ncbi:hypothetical protein LINPERPRIM_LOCUS2147 [Linum perenne]